MPDQKADVIKVMRNMGYKANEAKRRADAAIDDVGPDADLGALIKAALRTPAPEIQTIAEPPPELDEAEPALPIKKGKQSKRPRGRPTADPVESFEERDVEESRIPWVYLTLILLGAGVLTGLYFLGVAKGLAAILLFVALLYRMGTRITRPGAMRVG